MLILLSLAITSVAQGYSVGPGSLGGAAQAGGIATGPNAAVRSSSSTIIEPSGSDSRVKTLADVVGTFSGQGGKSQSGFTSVFSGTTQFANGVATPNKATPSTDASSPPDQSRSPLPSPSPSPSPMIVSAPAFQPTSRMQSSQPRHVSANTRQPTNSPRPLVAAVAPPTKPPNLHKSRERRMRARQNKRKQRNERKRREEKKRRQQRKKRNERKRREQQKRKENNQNKAKKDQREYMPKTSISDGSKNLLSSKDQKITLETLTVPMRMPNPKKSIFDSFGHFL